MTAASLVVLRAVYLDGLTAENLVEKMEEMRVSKKAAQTASKMVVMMVALMAELKAARMVDHLALM